MASIPMRCNVSNQLSLNLSNQQSAREIDKSVHEFLQSQ